MNRGYRKIMDKEKIILFIKNRIDAEYRKHHAILNWSEIAARKIYAELNHLNVVRKTEKEKKIKI